MRENTTIKIVLLVAAILLSTSANASCNSGSCTGVGSEVIASVYPTGGRIYVAPPAGYRDQLNCTLVSGQFMTLEITHSTFKEIYSTILTALATGKRLTVRIVEGSSNCRIAYVRMFTT